MEFLNNRAYKLSGKVFDLSQPSEVANILFGILELPQLGKRKRHNHPTTEKEALEALRRDGYEIADIIIEHRKLKYLLTHCVEPYEAFISMDRGSGRRVIHPVFSQTVFNSYTNSMKF